MERIITKSFARLMGRGIHRGFITHEELNKSLGKRNHSNSNLEQAFIHILDEKIELVEKNLQLVELSREIEELKELSREKLIFNEIAKEASLIYPDLKQFEISEKKYSIQKEMY